MKAPMKTQQVAARRRRVGKLRGGKDGYEPRSRLLERAAHVLALHEQGLTQEAIGQTEGISQAAVSKILRRADERAVAALAQQWIARKMRSLRLLEYLSREGRRAWEMSKQGRVRKRQRKADGAGGEPTVTHEIFVDEQPDPRMLDQARKAEEVIAEICGFIAVGRSDRDRIDAAVPALSFEEVAARLNAILASAPETSTASLPETETPPTELESGDEGEGRDE
jgi:hypothetical protein